MENQKDRSVSFSARLNPKTMVFDGLFDFEGKFVDDQDTAALEDKYMIILSDPKSNFLLKCFSTEGVLLAPRDLGDITNDLINEEFLFYFDLLSDREGNNNILTFVVKDATEKTWRYQFSLRRVRYF